MNDVDNLVATARPIVDAGMHHQLCVAMMGLPYRSDGAHAEYYVDVVRRVLESGVRVDSVCMKDASGTTDPTTVYETAKGLKRILPPEVPLWHHTHDTASMAVACYMAALEGGADGIDLSVRPLASGTSQPDVRSMWHALKGTGLRARPRRRAHGRGRGAPHRGSRRTSSTRSPSRPTPGWSTSRCPAAPSARTST
jgi:pyruvate carboxylase subunit B